MLHCEVILDHTSTLAIITIEEMRDYSSTLSDYHASITVDRGDEVGHHTFTIYRQPSHYRTGIDLVRKAMNLIPTATETIEGEVTNATEVVCPGPSDLEREVGGIVPSVSGETTSELRDHRSSLWGGQPVEHGRNQLGTGACSEDRQR